MIQLDVRMRQIHTLNAFIHRGCIQSSDSSGTIDSMIHIVDSKIGRMMDMVHSRNSYRQTIEQFFKLVNKLIRSTN